MVVSTLLCAALSFRLIVSWSVSTFAWWNTLRVSIFGIIVVTLGSRLDLMAWAGVGLWTFGLYIHLSW